MTATGSSRSSTSVICGPAKAVFRYSAPAPSFEQATVASMKPRWLRHMIATPSPSEMPGLAQLVRERIGPQVQLREGQAAALVDQRRPLRVARGAPVYAPAGVAPQRRSADSDCATLSGRIGSNMPVSSSDLTTSSLCLAVRVSVCAFT